MAKASPIENQQSLFSDIGNDRGNVEELELAPERFLKNGSKNLWPRRADYHCRASNRMRLLSRVCPSAAVIG